MVKNLLKTIMWSLNALHYRLTQYRKHCGSEKHSEQLASVVALLMVFSLAVFFSPGSATPHCFATKTNLNVDKAKSANLCTSNMHARTQF